MTQHALRLVALALLSCCVVVPTACKRRSLEVLPAASASAVVSLPPPAAEARPADSAIVAPAAAFADGGAPNGYEKATVWAVVPAGDGLAVLVLDPSKTTVVPIFVGGTEALTIRLRLDGERYGRPLTHDLLSTLVKELGGQVVKAQIDDLRDETYFGSLFVRKGDQVLELDARPSDAIAIALGTGAPLFVSRSVMLRAGVPRADIETQQKEDDRRARSRNQTSL